ncbi:MAG: chemotaxis protein CheX [Treponemataceae bacterium]
MNAAYINPFLTATLDLFEQSFGLKPVVGAPYIDERSASHRWDISAIMVLTGNAIGVIVLRLTRTLADKLLERSGVTWTNEEERERLVTGMVGELVNIIGGNASGKLTDFSVEISVPIVVQGKNHSVSWPDRSPIIAIPFTTSLGHFLVNVSLMELPAAYRKTK